jgi:hypothetical protein
MRTDLLCLTAAISMTAGTAPACSPAPSCWMAAGPAYLRTICFGYAKKHKTLKEIATYVEEPEKISDFAKACEKSKVHLTEE